MQGETDEAVFVVKEDEHAGGWVASCTRYGIFTQGDTLDDLRSNVQESVALRFEDEPQKPNSIRLHFVRDEVLSA